MPFASMDTAALIEELNEAVSQGTVGQRAKIIHRLTDLFAVASADYSDAQITLFDDILTGIAETIELSARAMLAKRLAREPRAPLKISRLLATDDAIDISGPMLEQSQRLDSDTLVATARTKSQQHLLAISKRRSLDEVVTDVLVERGDKAVVLSTAGNPGARFSDRGYTTLTTRSEGDDELATLVGLRRDIPRPHLMRLMARASHAVRQKLETANPSMTPLIEEAVSEATKTVLAKAQVVVRDYAAARAQVEALRADGRLNENEVAAFARANQFEETTAALAALCELPIETVDQAMGQDLPDAVLIMIKALGMSRDTAKAILRMRAGPRGISPGELEQCLDTLSRLSTGTARQIIKFRDNPSLALGARFSRAAG
ncbi:MAG TPA: DUF2336 domain-containing protein [Pseudolabrys sp.]|nr:DUF2336 domain-containing protein [Pseudolabrys sp.]